jgi:hypothetical protein
MSENRPVDIPSTMKKIEDVLRSINAMSSTSERDRLTTTTSGTRFVVELEGLRLPEETAKKIEYEIRKTVMSNIASLDLAPPSGERAETSGLLIRGPLGLPPGTYGIIIRPPSLFGGKVI